MARLILLVDDDHDFVEMNRSVLENRGYSVITADNAKDAIKLVESRKPDLLIIDVMMGSDVAGFDAVEEIRNLPDGKKLPILMITSFREHHKTAWTEKPDRSWVDVDNYLNKPVSPEKLIGEVDKLLSVSKG
jgi:two-component system, OmpR family, alkaline phosphatase synthesis response regulator PhoP